MRTLSSNPQAVAERIRLRMSRTAHDIIEIGRDLILTKEAVGYGNFLPWTEAEFTMSERAAQKFMSVAAQYEGKSATVADLPLTILYELAFPSTPDCIRDEVNRERNRQLAAARRAQKQAQADEAARVIGSRVQASFKPPRGKPCARALRSPTRGHCASRTGCSPTAPGFPWRTKHETRTAEPFLRSTSPFATSSRTLQADRVS